MPAHIPENMLEEILSRIDIVETISSCIPLKRSGRNFKALCPFHHEKTSSFMVSPDRQIYRCFGCGESGNAFKFLMKYEHLEFVEAVEVLAKKAGVILPERQKIDRNTESLYTQLYKINELAAVFYQETLNSSSGQSAKDYLVKRGINEAAVKLFKLGAAPEKWNGLINYLRAKNINLSLMEKAGLILPNDQGGYYDRFRNRIIFPIFDLKSRVLGFGGRVFTAQESGAKYINSPETLIYTKGNNLYGLNAAKDAIIENDLVVIVEGYLDFLTPYSAGLQNIVASLGTALTEKQVNLLKRYTQNVVMVYDADNAGQMATLRTLDIFIEEGMNVRVVSLPEGFDPDLFVRKSGIEKFREAIGQAKNLFDYKLMILKSHCDISRIEGKAKVSSEILPTINKFKNAVLKSEYIKWLAGELDVEEGALLQELKKVKEKRPFDSAVSNQKKPQSTNPTERLLLKLVMEETALIGRVREQLKPADFQDEKISKIISLMFDLIEQGKNVEPNKLLNHLEDKDSLDVVCEAAFDSEVVSQNRDKIIADCIKLIKNRSVVFLKQRLQEQIEIAEASGNEEKLNGLRAEFYNLIKKESGKKNEEKSIY
ncbi:MAG: DNA primase [Candidatus Omnitrophota bacterium]